MANQSADYCHDHFAVPIEAKLRECQKLVASIAAHYPRADVGNLIHALKRAQQEAAAVSHELDNVIEQSDE